MQDWLSQFLETSSLSAVPLLIIALFVIMLAWIVILIRGPRAIKLQVRGLGLDIQVTTTAATPVAHKSEKGGA